MPRRSATYMEDRRNAVLDAVDVCLDRDGMEGVSTPAICKEAGISMGALYNLFPNKDDIMLALARRRAGERMVSYQFDTAAEMRASVLALFDRWIHQQDRLRGEYEMLIARSRDNELMQSLEPTLTTRQLGDALQRLIDAKELRVGTDPAAAAEAIEAMVIGASVSVVIGKIGAETARAALMVLLDGLAAPAAALPD